MHIGLAGGPNVDSPDPELGPGDEPGLEWRAQCPLKRRRVCLMRKDGVGLGGLSGKK